MSETVENTTNGGEHGNNESDNSEIIPKVNGVKDSLNDSGTSGIEEPEDDENDNKDEEEETETSKRPSRRSASKPTNTESASKKTPSKKGAPRGRKSVGASANDSSSLKNKLPTYRDISVELCTKNIIIGKGTDFNCTSRSELTTIPSKEGKFGVGDLIWSKMTGYPWWPCMVAIDPQSGKHSRISGVSYKADHVYHVQYFGAEPSRGWTTIGMILPFEGYSKFADLIDDELSKVGDVKNGIKKVQDKYAVKPSLVNKWMESVCEAEKALKLDLNSRVKLLTFQYLETAPDKAPKPRTSKPAKVTKTELPKAETSKLKTTKTLDDLVKQTPKSKAGRKPKLVIKSEDAEESKDNIYEFDDDFEAEEQTPTFPTWTSRLPNDEEKRKAIFEHADNLLLGKRSTFDEDPFDSDDSDEVYVDSNPPSPVTTDKDDNDKKASRYEDNDVKDEPDSATKDLSATPIKRRGRKSKKMLELEQSQAKKSLKRSATPAQTLAGQSAKRLKTEKKLKATKELDVDEAEDDDEKDGPTSSITEVNGSTSGRIRKWGLVEDSEESGDNASELSANQASSKAKKLVNLICLKCGEDDTPELRLTTCTGICGGKYHGDCTKFVTTSTGESICEDCHTGIHPCFACGDKEDLDTKKCTNKRCSRFYHLHCIAANYPSKVNETSNSFECPLHSCMTCFQNELFTGSSKAAAKQIISCIYCPVAYHKNDVCIGAGTVELSRNFAICPDHYRTTKYKSNEDRQNINYCFSCCKNGSLTCCELCPASFHKDCLEYEVNTNEPFICVSCKRKFPLHYGDIVWSKSGAYRWWPAKIVSPNEIPKVLLNSHRYGEFPVYFFGSHNYAWSSKGRSYLFDEADSVPKAGNNKKALTATFKKAFVEAQDALAEAKKNKAIALQALTIKPPKYTSIVSNKYLISKSVADKSDEQVCNCKERNQTCSDVNCLNRATRHECSSKCPLGNECKNRRMANREIAKCQPVRSPLHGWGLIAQEPIKKDQFVIEYVGEVIDQAECERRIQESSKSTYYFLTLDSQSIIDAGPKGNWARFMNHSCEPNCIAEKWMVNGLPRVGLFALRDIDVGEELTFDYQYELRPGQENIKCTCGTDNCRNFVAKGQNAPLKRSAEDSGKKPNKKGRKPGSVAIGTGKKDNDVHEDVCNKCGDDGKLLMCEQDGCSKSFHLPCVSLERAPRGKWICPTHDENDTN